jgi:hypothetical protein
MGAPIPLIRPIQVHAMVDMGAMAVAMVDTEVMAVMEVMVVDMALDTQAMEEGMAATARAMVGVMEAMAAITGMAVMGMEAMGLVKCKTTAQLGLMGWSTGATAGSTNLGKWWKWWVGFRSCWT